MFGDIVWHHVVLHGGHQLMVRFLEVCLQNNACICCVCSGFHVWHSRKTRELLNIYCQFRYGWTDGQTDRQLDRHTCTNKVWQTWETDSTSEDVLHLTKQNWNWSSTFFKIFLLLFATIASTRLFWKISSEYVNHINTTFP